MLFPSVLVEHLIEMNETVDTYYRSYAYSTFHSWGTLICIRFNLGWSLALKPGIGNSAEHFL